MEVPAQIEVTDGVRVILTWEDQTQSVIPADRLRAACQCADCRSPEGEVRKLKILDVPGDIKITEAQTVGAYAIHFVFAPDSHGTGIFTFDQLHGLGSSGSRPAR